MTGSRPLDGVNADVVPARVAPGHAISGNGRSRHARGTLHTKNIALTIPERIAIEEVRSDPAYDPSIEQYLKDVDRQLVPYMREAVALVPDVETLRAGVAAQIHTGGKRIRAALCVVCCELFGADYMRALAYAAAIEHIQNLTLIHDDIADGDTERRSRPALWKQYGVPHAINIGDAFIPLASLSILRALYPDAVKLKLLDIVAQYGLEMTVGQSIDINLRTRETFSVADYITCTRMKTGAFLAMAVVGGGLIGGGSPAHLELLRRYARLAGVAFQIKDDSLDLTGGKGRQIGSDIVEGKITVHAVYAMNNSTPEERVRLRRILAKSRRSTQRDEVEWVLSLYRRVGAATFAERTATGMIEAAAQHLLLLPESPQRERLIQLSRYLSRRVR
jgi:geranylgeranyl pyrophosphate synthase